MDKIEFSAKDFRKVLQKIIASDRTHFSHGEDGGFEKILNRVEQMSDEELLQANLYTDLEMDSIDVWEMVCLFERDYDVFITDNVEQSFGTNASLTVQNYLNAINSHQS